MSASNLWAGKNFNFHVYYSNSSLDAAVIGDKNTIKGDFRIYLVGMEKYILWLL